MGRGDKKSAKGKRFAKSFGNTRPKAKKLAKSKKSVASSAKKKAAK